jgi:hypothetical protein
MRTQFPTKSTKIRSITPMNRNTLNDFRHEIYRCFGKAKDALFNLVDALASEAGARSFPELSLSPFFERTWASLYEALEDGRIDVERLRNAFLGIAPLPEPGQVVFLGVDTSNLYRSEAETAADRTLVPIANLPKNMHASCPGWVVSHVVLLPQQAGQGTFVLDTVRVRSTELATEVAARQLRTVVAALAARGLRPIILGDRWYACAPFLARTVDLEACNLLRVKSNRVFYRPSQPVFLANWASVAKMETAFNAKTRARTGKPMRPGKGLMPKGQRSRSAVGSTCTFAPPASWKSRSSKSFVMARQAGRVTRRSAGLSGKGTARHRWLRSARSTSCGIRTSMATASTSKNCSGMCHG